MGICATRCREDAKLEKCPAKPVPKSWREFDTAWQALALHKSSNTATFDRLEGQSGPGRNFWRLDSNWIN
jgi:hypothetical protein